MKIEQIDKAIRAIKEAGINLDQYEPVEIEADYQNYENFVRLVWIHKTLNIKMTVEDPACCPTTFEVKHLD